MTKKQRIRELEKRVADLEREIERLRDSANFTPMLPIEVRIVRPPFVVGDWPPAPQPHTDGTWQQYEVICLDAHSGPGWSLC